MNALVKVEPSNVDVYRASTDAAGLCKDIAVRTAKNIQGRKYICVEGWQAIALAHGCAASARDVEQVEGGVRAIGEIRRMSDGIVIATAEGFVGEDEPTWYGGKAGNKTLPKRPDYAIRAMAQTRAISRAGRSAFAHVVVMMDAGLSTTPAEEVPDGGFDDRPASDQPRRQQREPEDAVALITDDQRDIIQGLATAADVSLQVICEGYKICSLRDLPAHKFEKLARRLREDVKARAPQPASDAGEGDILDDEIPF